MSNKLKILLGTFFLLTIGFNLSVYGEQQFMFLAKSFLAGRTYFLEIPGTWGDALFFEGRYYWHLGVLPTLLMVPGVWFLRIVGGTFFQGYVQPLFVFGVYFLVYSTARNMGYTKGDSAWWGLAFCFGSAFLGVAMWPWSWYFVQVIAVFFVWAALWFNEMRKSDLRVGIFSGLLLLTRLQGLVGVATYYFVRLLLQRDFILRRVGVWAVPMLISFLVFGFYNQIRFGDWWRIGYELQTHVPEFLTRAKSLYGEFSLSHMPRNLYYLLLSGPKPVFEQEDAKIIKPPYLIADEWGMGILFTSPYVVYLFAVNMRESRRMAMMLGAVVGVMPALLYFGTGFRQFGYRYALDVWPLVFWVIMDGYREKNSCLSRNMKVLFAVAALLNFYLFMGLWV